MEPAQGDASGGAEVTSVETDNSAGVTTTTLTGVANTDASADTSTQTEPEPQMEADADTDMSSDRGRRRRHRRANGPDGHREIVRAEAGNWGMQFVFGGLAPMSIAGVNRFAVNRLLFSEIGVRRVFKRVVLPFSVGLGVFHQNPDGSAGNQNDFGLSASMGVLVPFRVWRRIAPYVGGSFHIRYLDPTGDNNWLVGFSIGPLLGIEYYVAHRVSLLLQANATLGINIFDSLTQIGANTNISAGGQMGLVFYF